MPQDAPDLPPNTAEPEEPPDHKDALPADVNQALLELFLCDAEIEARSRGLEVEQALLAAARWNPTSGPPRREVETAIGRLLDHLRPAREVVRGIEARYSPSLETAARRQTHLRAVDHLLYLEFFAGIDEETVAALRHRECCPVCARMTRLLLLGFLSPPGSALAGCGPSAGRPGEGPPEEA